MNIDKRYVELLADAVPKKPSKKFGRLSGLGYITLVVGGLIFLKVGLYSLGLMGIGMIGIGIATVGQNKVEKKARQEFMDYFNKNGALPPFPEPEVKKPELTKDVK